MEHSLDSIGEHFVPVTYQSEVHSKDFQFFVKVQIRPKIVVTATDGKKDGRQKLEAAKW